MENLDNQSLPLSWSSDFLWNRSFQLRWDLTKNIHANFSSGTNAEIEQPYTAVNKDLYPDRYTAWKDSVWQSIKHLGRPLTYQQNFDFSWKLPLNKIPLFDWITTDVSYNATYNWARGSELQDGSTLIGVNGGSLEKEILEKYGEPTPEGMIESAMKHVKILEDLDFHDIVISLKSSNTMLTIKAYELASKTFPYPLHVGVTEAGTALGGTIKSALGIGTLLYEGIGNTIRVSLSDDPVEEIKVAKILLKELGLLKGVPTLVSCPTCGRIQYDLIPIAKEMEDFLKDIHLDITVAIMGCAVNGPGEARHADIGIAGGVGEGLLIKHGEIVKRVKQEDMVQTLKDEILKMVEEKSE